MHYKLRQDFFFFFFFSINSLALFSFSLIYNTLNQQVTSMGFFSNLFGRNNTNKTYTRLPSPSTFIRPKRWRIVTIIKYAILIIATVVISFFAICQLQVNVRVYLRDWISHADEEYYKPLAGCFDSLPENSPYLNGVNQYAYDVAPGISLMEDYDCYDFAATIKSEPLKYPISKEKTVYHAYQNNLLHFARFSQLKILIIQYSTCGLMVICLFLQSFSKSKNMLATVL